MSETIKLLLAHLELSEFPLVPESEFVPLPSLSNGEFKIEETVAAFKAYCKSDLTITGDVKFHLNL